MSANKFKVGDKVRVRKNLVKGRQYGRIYYNADMAGLGLSGKTFTISTVDINVGGQTKCLNQQKRHWITSAEAT